MTLAGLGSYRRVSVMLLGVGLAIAAGAAQQPTGTFTDDQARSGQLNYQQHCADCHLANLTGSAHGPELTGTPFLDVWGKRPARELVTFVKENMPPGAAGTMSDDLYLTIVAYLLQRNGHTAGSQPLGLNSGLLIGSPGPVQAAPAATQSAAPLPPRDEAHSANLVLQARSAFENKEVKAFRPVTDEMLQHPDAGDWLSWRRTLDGQGFSPLAQITRDNVSRLRLAWAWTMKAEGANQPVPLVHDGIMYLINTQNVVQALDARTGDLIWEYAYAYPPDAMVLGGPTRNIALYRDKIFMTTYDAAIVAISAKTGKLVWRTEKGDYRKGFTHTSGPVVADGVVISGINGCERFKKEGCFITGHDPDTGRELWRTSTIALPGDPNNASWGKVPPELRAGSDAWIPGSYDPQLKLFYIGTAQAKPWVAASRGMSPEDAALYTNSTLALDPHTGRMVWYFQHLPGDTLDMDIVFERVLVDVDGQKTLLTIGKDGILWKLDRRTGKYLDLTETVYQDLYSTVDKKSGRVTFRPDIMHAGIGDDLSICPATFGGHDWQATAYSPETGALIIPLQQVCGHMKGRKVDLVEGSGGFAGGGPNFEMPNVRGQLGKLTAIDVKTMKPLWTHEQRAMFLTGVLTTAGGLAFVGDVDRYFKAFDVKTGKVVWQTRLASPVEGFPMTYSAGGKQYIAVPTGLGVFRGPVSALSKEIYLGNITNALYVFELPE